METRTTFGITSHGMVTALGLNAVQSCAAARGGLVRQQPLSLLTTSVYGAWDEEFELTGHCVPSVADGFVGIGKAIELGRHALEDLLSRCELDSAELARTGFYLNLSSRLYEDICVSKERIEMQESIEKWAAESNDEAYDVNEGVDEAAEPEHGPFRLPSEEWKDDAQSLIETLCRHANIRISGQERRSYFHDHAGIGRVIRDSVVSIKNGSIDRCIIGAIDSYVEPRVLVAAAQCGVSRTGGGDDGFIPGEAAAFLLLERGRADSRNIVPISGIGASEETFGRFDGAPPQGRALISAISEALNSSGETAEDLGLIICDINGDQYRSMDWGHALVRMKSQLQLQDIPAWYPVSSFGEVGAATGIVSIIMAIIGFERGYAPRKCTMICLSSDNGERAAIALRPHDSR